jgi:hypothetical protein
MKAVVGLTIHVISKETQDHSNIYCLKCHSFLFFDLKSWFKLTLSKRIRMIRFWFWFLRKWIEERKLLKIKQRMKINLACLQPVSLVHFHLGW